MTLPVIDIGALLGSSGARPNQPIGGARPVASATRLLAAPEAGGAESTRLGRPSAPLQNGSTSDESGNAACRRHVHEPSISSVDMSGKETCVGRSHHSAQRMSTDSISSGLNHDLETVGHVAADTVGSSSAASRDKRSRTAEHEWYNSIDKTRKRPALPFKTIARATRTIQDTVSMNSAGEKRARLAHQYSVIARAKRAKNQRNEDADSQATRREKASSMEYTGCPPARKGDTYGRVTPNSAQAVDRHKNLALTFTNENRSTASPHQRGSLEPLPIAKSPFSTSIESNQRCDAMDDETQAELRSVVPSSKEATKADMESAGAADTIREPHPNDILSGRGSVNWHKGNVMFRNLITERKDRYMNASKKADKRKIATAIVALVKNQVPAGRFLTRDSNPPSEGPTLWIEMDDVKAVTKTMQAFRYKGKQKDEPTKRKACDHFITPMATDFCLKADAYDHSGNRALEQIAYSIALPVLLRFAPCAPNQDYVLAESVIRHWQNNGGRFLKLYEALWIPSSDYDYVFWFILTTIRSSWISRWKRKLSNNLSTVESSNRFY